ncbi:COX15/CtaA family protein [Micrococcales bacterium 31B]|nr:COX15/CtaA family protein [Micrococcales bacterium 31B]
MSGSGPNTERVAAGGVAGVIAAVRRFFQWIIPMRFMRTVFVINLALQILIIVTGVAVRVTASGLGCPTWPECFSGQGITPPLRGENVLHQYIEFGNRSLTGVLVVAAGALVVLAFTHMSTRSRSMTVLMCMPTVGVVMQAVIGGITVRTNLNPYVVSLHFLASAFLVVVSAILLMRFGLEDGRPRLLVRREMKPLFFGLAAVGLVVVVLGVAVTGSGPHSGDGAVEHRMPFNIEQIAWLHADAVMLFIGLAVAMYVALRVLNAPAATRKHAVWLLGITLSQGLIGYVQYFTGVPEVLVMLHALGAGLLIMQVTLLGCSLWTRDPSLAR